MITNLTMYFLMIYITATAQWLGADNYEDLFINKDELYFLAENTYWEARGESELGQIAVTHVVLNRVAHSKYPNTICEVIHQGVMKESWKTAQYPDLPDEERIYFPVKNKCKFSWWCDGRPDDIELVDKESEQYRMPAVNAWKESVITAVHAYLGVTNDPTIGATHYFAHDIINTPSWAKVYKVTTIIGGHTFLQRP